MKEDYCDFTLIIDKSGSMGPLQMDTIGGINQFLNEQKLVPGECKASIILFDTTVQSLCLGRDIKEVSDLNTQTYSPGGATALLDAVGTGIRELGGRLSKMPEDQRPSKVVLVIATDGEENSSVKFTKQQIADMVKHQKEAYKWEFVFLGADINAFAEAQGLNVAHSHTIQTRSTPESTAHVYAAACSNLTSYRTGNKSDMSWEATQREAQQKMAKK